MKKNLKKVLKTRAMALSMAFVNAVLVIKVANAYGVNADFLGYRLVALATITLVAVGSFKAVKTATKKTAAFVKAAVELADMKYRQEKQN